MTEFDVIQKAQHYNSHPSGVECIEIARYLTGDWFNAFKYVFRAEHKNGHQDLEKAKYYADDAQAQRIPIDALPEVALIKLGRVIAAETDPDRLMFFHAIGRQDSYGASIAISRMVHGGPPLPRFPLSEALAAIEHDPAGHNWEGTQHG